MVDGSKTTEACRRLMAACEKVCEELDLETVEILGALHMTAGLLAGKSAKPGVTARQVADKGYELFAMCFLEGERVKGKTS